MQIGQRVYMAGQFPDARWEGLIASDPEHYKFYDTPVYVVHLNRSRSLGAVC
jgi:hypothetical protein